MKQIAAAAFALLSLSSVAEAHRLSGAATTMAGATAVRTSHGFWGGVRLRRVDGRTPDAAFRHGTVGPEPRPVDSGHRVARDHEGNPVEPGGNLGDVRGHVVDPIPRASVRPRSAVAAPFLVA